ncbi:hypothetical protein NE619_11725 [Anaerovorax odorimutans]|uniref:Uncharacterized protein n=1 Tax=Anaerovorax odorimutans TaxID=109327 RepID=A0ABT1RQC2_9FIRM|nr:hypothetical protein [Anaerovorax odorimutans]MCQ4637394.1 hypothetical protein [Anaerovorax odorimutans]
MSFIYIVLCDLQEMLPILILFLLPLRDRLRFSNRINIPCTLFYFAIVFFTSSPFLSKGVLKASLSISIVPYMGLAALICCFFCKKRKIVNLFILFILKSYTDIIHLVVKSTNLFTFLKDTHTSLEATILGKCCLTLVTFPLICLFVVRLLKPLIDKTEEFDFWKYLWFIPGLFFLCFHLMLTFVYGGFSDSVRVSAPMFPFIWIFATFLTYYLILRMLSETVDMAEIKEKLRMAEIQTEHQKKQYEDLLQQIEKGRTARHDLRHILLVLDSYAEKDDLPAFRSYLSQVLKDKK